MLSPIVIAGPMATPHYVGAFYALQGYGVWAHLPSDEELISVEEIN
jgi:hypothetical protein